MRNVSKILIGLCAAGAVLPAAAQVTIDGQTVSDVEIRSVYLYKPNGQMNIRTVQGNYTLVPQSGEGIVDPSARPMKVDGVEIPGVELKNVYFDASTGYYTMETVQGGYTLAPLGSTSEPEPEPEPEGPMTLSVQAAPTAIEVGQTTTISWTTQNATSCATKLGTSEWLAMDPGTQGGSVDMLINTAGDYTFRIRCVNDNGEEIIRGANVVATAPVTNAQCDSPTLSGSTVDFQSLFGSPWPGPTAAEIGYFGVGRYTYKAIRFNTGNVVGHGRFGTVETAGTAAVRYGAISECPGDFDVPEECRTKFGNEARINGATDGTPGCQLQPNKTYYFNITFTDGVDPDSTTCTSVYTVCNTKLRYNTY